MRTTAIEMQLTPFMIFLILAAVSFGLAAFRVSSPRVDFVPLGYALVVLAFVVGRF